ncbi:MAG: hypothetical protein R3F34_16040 [Planctomycetota bacterium]
MNVPSLNDGRNDVPKVEASHTAAAVASAASPSTAPRKRIATRSDGS